MEEVDILQRNVSINIPFSTSEFACLAYDVLSVDKELKGSGVQRLLSVEGTNLLINFNADDLKRLRVAVNSCLKNVVLVVKTISKFNQV